MVSTVQILLEGYPERVNAVASMLDKAAPDAFEWSALAVAGDEFQIRLRGVGRWGKEAAV